MSEIPLPPPAPPVPPLIVSETLNTDFVKTHVVQNLKKLSVTTDRLSQIWLNESRKLVDRLNTGSEDIDGKKIVCCFLSHFTPVVQEGPQCGLITLCMASECFPEKLCISEVFEKAKEKKYTSKGEMFLAEDMLSLGRDLLNCDGKIICSNNRRNEIINELLNQSLILVPYDRDCNNEPCFKNGKKAHWALLTGILFSCSDNILEDQIENASHQLNLQRDEEIKNFYHVNSDCVCSEYINADTVSDVYVFAQQGKSLRTHLWPLEQLLQSNSQLNELDPKIVEHIGEYVIPEGGVTRGLNDKVVCFWRKK